MKPNIFKLCAKNTQSVILCS